MNVETFLLEYWSELSLGVSLLILIYILGNRKQAKVETEEEPKLEVEEDVFGEAFAEPDTDKDFVSITKGAIGTVKNRNENLKKELFKNKKDIESELKKLRETKKEIYGMAQALKTINDDFTKKERILMNNLEGLSHISGLEKKA